MIPKFWYNLLHFLGVHPHYPLSKIKIVVNLSAIFCLSVLNLVNVLVKKETDPMEAMESLSLLCSGALKYSTYIFGKQILIQLLETKEQFWETSITDKKTAFIMNHVNRVDNIYKVVFYTGTSACVLKLFLLHEISMFNCYKPPQIPFALFFLLELYVVALLAAGYISFNIFSCFLISMVAVQFRVLKLDIKTLKLSGIGKQEDLNDSRISLRRKIKYHQLLIGYVEDLKSLFSLPIGLFLVLSVNLLCIDVYVISMNKGSIFAYAKSFIVATAMTMEFTSVYGMPAQYLMDESTELADTVYYELEWYLPKAQPIRKDILIMIARCQKTITLKAGGYHVVSHETILVMLRIAYSFYTFLQTM